ncbi:uncharacterized protein N7483_003260 [Penicillium malachiteum]|uniref:uncharacterized protein n=1 Tax=Penicillium malachiteum TaxID=1324776 RepID=UPI002546E9FF|nr:uncharacterized protein N7483_003260 [Penicillium malachiteum]KAJ5728752.1 hypothetical protein N7483_003260 [Penicillium malachiteum]
MDQRPSKRTRLSSSLSSETRELREEVEVHTSLTSLRRSVSPPPRTRSGQSHASIATIPRADLKNDQFDHKRKETSGKKPALYRARQVPSPFQLTHIRDLPDKEGSNDGTVKLRDILGDPMIKECWQFNYCFDVDFLMSQFDEDVRSLVQVKIVHGSWEKESANRIRIDEACARFPNVEAITAYMPERFGTHHSKMMILLRHDDLAQVIIHTANMILGDWTNMTQAVWRSPLLPLLKGGASSSSSTNGDTSLGTGARFKRDLLTYLRAYGPKKTGSLVQQLSRYDFAAIRAALVSSVPSKQNLCQLYSDKATLWGWPALKDVLGRVPVTHRTSEKTSRKPRVVIQISSVATLGATDKWLKSVLFEALAPTSNEGPPNYSIIFPTPDEIRQSLDGYGSGGSIHMKTQSAPQKKQLEYLRPYLCHWSGNIETIDHSGDKHTRREAGRGRAAPHIKTYIRFSDEDTMNSVDWAMVTSANLSTQAWGTATNQSGEVKISSFEIGVVVWPELYKQNPVSSESDATVNQYSDVLMVPCFKQNQPDMSNLARNAATVVGLRMPYSLPLTPYGPTDAPWCATESHYFPDWRGLSWVL